MRRCLGGLGDAPAVRAARPGEAPSGARGTHHVAEAAGLAPGRHLRGRVLRAVPSATSSRLVEQCEARASADTNTMLSGLAAFFSDSSASVSSEPAGRAALAAAATVAVCARREFQARISAPHGPRRLRRARRAAPPAVRPCGSGAGASRRAPGRRTEERPALEPCTDGRRLHRRHRRSARVSRVQTAAAQREARTSRRRRGAAARALLPRQQRPGERRAGRERRRRAPPRRHSASRRPLLGTASAGAAHGGTLLTASESWLHQIHGCEKSCSSLGPHPIAPKASTTSGTTSSAHIFLGERRVRNSRLKT
jgi:hypothetical protein